MATAKEYVENGAKLLTDYFGDESWKRRIDLDKLDMSRSSLCILGQVFTLGYDSGLKKLKIRHTDYVYGFSHDHGLGISYQEMLQAWVEYLEVPEDSNKKVALLGSFSNGVLFMSSNTVAINAAMKALDNADVSFTKMVEE